MSVESPESLNNDTARDVSFLGKDLPRKRSKVSRACDACRRKKIRCNAEYLSTLLRVTKFCTNCTKTGETCLFSRVPMKRGPSKGYIRDLVDHLDDLENMNGFTEQNDSTDYRPRLKLVDTAGLKYFFPGLKGEPSLFCPPSPMSQTLSKSHFYHLLNFAAPPGQVTQPIILPPLIGAQPLTQPVKLSLPIPKYSASVSPHSGGAPLPKLPSPLPNTSLGENAGNRIQGPLWKVPYEMPVSNTPRSSISSPGGSNNVNIDSRRSSVDSVSSILTSGSVSRLPSLQPSAPPQSDSAPYTSDLEDNSGCSEILSPRNSISSLLLLNGRMANTLTIAQPEYLPPHSQQNKIPPYEHAPNQPQLQYFQQFQQHPATTQNVSPPVSFQHFANQPPHIGSIPFQASSRLVARPKLLDLLDHYLKLYYNNFHGAFPILPFDELSIPKMVSGLQNSCPQDLNVVNFFVVSLRNLIDYQLVSFEAIRDLLLNFTSIYPFGGFPTPCQNDVLYLMFSALLLTSYTILLRGDSCPIGISLANGAFTDFKVLQNFKRLSSERIQQLDRDDIQLYLPRLYVCLQIIDNCQALSWGTQSQILKHSKFLPAILIQTFSQKNFGLEFLENTELGKIFEILEDLKCDEIFNDKPRSKRGSIISSLSGHFPNSNLSRLIFCLQNDKYELFDFAMEVVNFFESHPNIDFQDDYTKDHMHDYQLKTSRLVKKVSKSILSFANHISSAEFQTKSMHLTKDTQQASPFLNVIYGQSFRLVKVSKVLLECLIENSDDNEIISRSLNIINDLSTATNLLTMTLKKNLSDIENARYMRSGNSQLGSPGSGVLAIRGPGISSIQIILRKLEIFDLNFKNGINMQLSKVQMGNFEIWGEKFMKTSTSIIFCEDLEGWL